MIQTKFRRLTVCLIYLLVFMIMPVMADTLLLKSPHPYELSVHSGNKSLKQVLSNQLEAHRTHISKQNQNSNASRIVENDIEVLSKVLRAQGYYEGTVNVERIPGKDGNEKLFLYHIIEGPLYRLGKIDFNLPAYLNEDFTFNQELQTGDPILADKVLETINNLQNKLVEACLLDVDLKYDLLLSKANSTGDIRIKLKKTQKARIQELHFIGLQSISEEFLLNRTQIKPGDCFNRSKLEQARIDLLQTNLLGKVDVTTEYDKTMESLVDHFLPVTLKFKVEERKHKTVKFGLGYSTDEGAGARIGWENRNLFNAGEDLQFELGSNEIKQFFKGNYRVPNFFRTDQSLNLQSELKKETTDAFKSTKAKSTATVSRALNKKTVAELGLALSHAEVVEDDIKRKFDLVSLPVGLSLEARNNLLDPTSGWHASTAVAPFTDISKENVRFLRWTANGSAYFSSNGFLRPTLALRVAIGASTGTALDNIPADERYYVGGGGSVWGYAYQTVGNLTDGEADGGKSFAEATIELRLKLSETWGITIFTDGGYAYPDELPKFGTDFLLGAGIGLRYHTSFAPIRFDLARPLNRREDVDDPLQFYVSIGQSF